MKGMMNATLKLLHLTPVPNTVLFIITIAKHKPYIHSKAVKEALNAIDQVRAEEA